MWRPDGWGWRARIGLLVPQSDICPEAEFRAMAPEGVSIHASRVPFMARATDGAIPMVGTAVMRAFLEPPLLDDAAALIAAAPVHAVALCFTNSSFLGPIEDDQALVQRLQKQTHGIPVIVTCLSAVQAFHAAGARRIALVNPPWIEADITAAASAYFTGAGFEIVLARSVDGPRGQGDVHPGRLYEWIKTHVPAEADAVFIGGNGFRAVGAIEALEEDLGRPVLTANQVLLWHVLRLAGTNVRVAGYGRIFDLPLPR